MKKHIFWRLFKAAVLATVVWSVITLDVYGWNNNSNSGGTLMDVFRGRSSSPEQAPPLSSPTPANASYGTPVVPAPQLTNVNGYGQPQGVVETPHNHYHGSQYAAPPAPSQQGAGQNKWSLKSWITGAAPVQPQSQYVEPAPPLEPAYNPPNSHSQQSIMPSGQRTQYPVVPLDSEDFRPQEGAIYNEKGEIIYFPNGSEPPFDGANGEIVYDNNAPMSYNMPPMQEALPMDQNIPPMTQSMPPMEQNVPPMTQSAPPVTQSAPQTIPPTQKAPESTAKRIIMGRSSAGRSSVPVNQERVYNQGQSNPSGVARPDPIPAQIPVNPYAQQPSTAVGRPPVGTQNSILNSENSGTLKLNSGSTAFSKTYTPGPARSSVPTEPVMDMAGPQLTDALPQSGNREQESGLPLVNSTPYPAVGAPTPETSPIIEELPNASPLENLTESNNQTPALEPVPESVPEIDIPKEKLGNSEQGVGNSNSPSANSTPLATRNSQLATSQTDNRQEAVDKGNSSDTNSTPHTSPLTPNTQTPPLIIEIDGPDEVEFGKNEMFSLSVINTTDAVRRDIDLSVHPEGFGDDKTASVNLEQLAPGEKKSVFMKLNARQYNNLSLTAQVRDALGFETTKTINVNVKNESVKISILPPQTGNVYVGQPTQYIVRIVNNADKTISFNAMAFFGNGIEPIRASGAPNTIQSGQVVVDQPIELKQGEMRDLKIVAIAFQPGIHKILVHVIDSNGATYAAKESCAYRQREFDNEDAESTEKDARIELTPGKSEFGVWKPAGAAGVKQEQLDSSDSPEMNSTPHSSPPTPNSQTQEVTSTPSLNSPDAVPLTQPDQGPKGDLIMPMFAQ